MFKRIRSKLAVVLAIPLAILVVVAYLGVYASLTQSQTIAAQGDLATTAIGPSGLVSALQTERNQAGLQLLGFDSKIAVGVASPSEARTRVDAARSAFQVAIATRAKASVAAYRPALAALVHIERLRSELDDFHGTPGVKSADTTLLATTLFNGYTTIIQAFFDANTHIAGSVDDASLRTGIELLDVTLRQQEAESLAIRDAFLATLAGGLAASGQMPAFITDVADLHNWTQRAAVLATGPYATPVQTYTSGQAITTLNGVLSSYLHGAPIDLTALLAASNPAGAPGVKASAIPGAALQNQLALLVSQRASHLRNSARNRLKLFIALALLAAGLAVAIMTRASRSITEPLRRLAAQADTMAKITLPAAVQSILDTPPGEDVVVPKVAPITVGTRDEVSEVAAALTTVQDSAVALAVEQAVLRRNIADSFVNLGRRNQNLLGRQLDFISALEETETESSKLDDLFRLDHLATRMRRNAESLLVLAGLESPRQWSAPVPIADVLRASLAEVEDYRRVDIRDVDAAALPGSIAADLAHIIAELVENALVSSPPETQVEVYGRASESDYLISVVDRGVGMTEGDRERANRRLAGGESFTVAPSRYLGHYVAGNLAARYGIRLSLHESDAGGIKARVSLPAVLFHQPAPLASPPSAPGSSAVASSAAPAAAAAYGERVEGTASGVGAMGAVGVAAGGVTNATSQESPPASLVPDQPMGPAPALGLALPPLPALPALVLVPRLAPEVVVPAAVVPAAVVPAAVVPAAVADGASVPTAPQVPAEHPIMAPPLSQTAFSGPSDPASADRLTTASGLIRRVPGATIAPEADDKLLRRTDDEPVEGATSPHEVYRMLANLWSDTNRVTTPPATADRPPRKESD